MNKADLVIEVQKLLGNGISKAAAERTIDAVVTGIKRGIKKDREVQLVGFGTFKVAKRAARRGVNPRTKLPITIKAARIIKFKPGLLLKELVG